MAVSEFAGDGSSRAWSWTDRSVPFVGVRMNHRVDETVPARIPTDADTRLTDVSPGT
jgi:hypothetical protein